MLSTFLQRFTQLFRPDHCRQLAKEHGWQKCRGKISAFEFLYSLVFGQSSALALTLNAQATSLSQTVSRQAVDQRYTPAAVASPRVNLKLGGRQGRADADVAEEAVRAGEGLEAAIQQRHVCAQPTVGHRAGRQLRGVQAGQSAAVAGEAIAGVVQAHCAEVRAD